MPILKARHTEYGYIQAGTGPLIIMAHGTFGGKELFQPQLEQLATQFRCISIDWPGHGDSTYDPTGWNVDDLVDDVPEIISALGAQSAALAGVSQGGAVFMRAALRYPEIVDALVLMCSGDGPPDGAGLDTINRFARQLQDVGDAGARREIAMDFAQAVFHAPEFATANPDAVAAEVDLILSHPRAALPLLVGVPASYHSIRDRLAEIRCPTLVIWGGYDPRPLLGAEIAATIPDSEYQVIDHAGHHVNVDAPLETAELIVDFLTRRINATTAGKE